MRESFLCGLDIYGLDNDIAVYDSKRTDNKSDDRQKELHQIRVSAHQRQQVMSLEATWRPGESIDMPHNC